MVQFSENPSWEWYVEDEMNTQKKKLIGYIRASLAGDLLDNFIKMFASAYSDECPHAKLIADKLHLDQQDFNALNENHKAFEMKLIYQMEEDAVDSMLED